jgi:predicted DNA-binding protein with PD1-like motif
MKAFRGGTPAEFIPFHLVDGEDLVPTLARAAEVLHLGTAMVVMGSGNLSLARLLPAGTAGPDPLGVVTVQEGSLAIVSMHGWILANQPEIHLTLFTPASPASLVSESWSSPIKRWRGGVRPETEEPTKQRERLRCVGEEPRPRSRQVFTISAPRPRQYRSASEMRRCQPCLEQMAQKQSA